MYVGDPFGDRQPQARSLVLAARGVDAIKALEDVRQVGGRNANAVVRYGEARFAFRYACSVSATISRRDSALSASMVGFRNAHSAVVRMKDTGLRSSCEASAVKRVIWLTASSSRDSIALQLSASCCSSSPAPETGSRRERLP